MNILGSTISTLFVKSFSKTVCYVMLVKASQISYSASLLIASKDNVVILP